MFLKYDPYRVWCSILYSKLINCILFKMIMQHVRFVKGRGTFQSRERNVNFFYRFSEVPQILLLRIDRNLCSVHEEITSIRLYTLCNPRSSLRKGVYNLIEVLSNEPNTNCDQSLTTKSGGLPKIDKKN